MKTYYFTAKCAVSVGCEHTMEIEAESFEEAENIAMGEAEETFGGWGLQLTDEDGCDVDE